MYIHHTHKHTQNKDHNGQILPVTITFCGFILPLVPPWPNGLLKVAEQETCPSTLCGDNDVTEPSTLLAWLVSTGLCLIKGWELCSIFICWHRVCEFEDLNASLGGVKSLSPKSFQVSSCLHVTSGLHSTSHPPLEHSIPINRLASSEGAGSRCAHQVSCLSCFICLL